MELRAGDYPVPIVMRQQKTYHINDVVRYIVVTVMRIHTNCGQIYNSGNVITQHPINKSAIEGKLIASNAPVFW